MTKMMVRMVAKLVRAILVVLALVTLIPVAGLAYGWMTTDPVQLAAQDIAEPPPAIAERLRAEVSHYQQQEASTFLSYPEWSIAYSARDYARFIAGRRESGFPYWAYVELYWRDYATMIRATAGYPFSFRNHLMPAVTGAGHTIENAVQSIYENTVGRLTELVSPIRTPQDRFVAMVASEYAGFVHHMPWYEFPFAEKRAALWETRAAVGVARLRSWERKIVCGAAYTFKQVSADLVRAALGSTATPRDVLVWATGPVETAIADIPDTSLVEGLGDDGAVFGMRRNALTDMAAGLVEQGIRFVQIDGSNLILLTVLASGDTNMPADGQQLFAHDLPADPSTRRIGVVLPVSTLHETIRAILAGNGRIERIYDY